MVESREIEGRVRMTREYQGLNEQIKIEVYGDSVDVYLAHQGMSKVARAVEREDQERREDLRPQRIRGWQAGNHTECRVSILRGQLKLKSKWIGARGLYKSEEFEGTTTQHMPEEIRCTR